MRAGQHTLLIENARGIFGPVKHPASATKLRRGFVLACMIAQGQPTRKLGGNLST